MNHASYPSYWIVKYQRVSSSLAFSRAGTHSTTVIHCSAGNFSESGHLLERYKENEIFVTFFFENSMFSSAFLLNYQTRHYFLHKNSLKIRGYCILLQATKYDVHTVFRSL